MIPREILKKIRQIELRMHRIVSVSVACDPARIPTGFRPKAQGCDAGATLGNAGLKSQPQRGCVRPASLATTTLALWDFRQLAQGREERATLGQHSQKIPNRNAVAAIPVSSAARGIGHNPVGVDDDLIPFTQGSACVATLGWRTQSRWDWLIRLTAKLQTGFAVRANLLFALHICQQSQTITTPTGSWQPV